MSDNANDLKVNDVKTDDFYPDSAQGPPTLRFEPAERVFVADDDVAAAAVAVMEDDIDAIEDDMAVVKLALPVTQ
ncbi:hypothetical protein C0991_001404 [Blastosporella zonata]|nr:hypothetical protein C0991_001404 [Blastosporella zonata]